MILALLETSKKEVKIDGGLLIKNLIPFLADKKILGWSEILSVDG